MVLQERHSSPPQQPAIQPLLWHLAPALHLHPLVSASCGVSTHLVRRLSAVDETVQQLLLVSIGFVMNKTKQLVLLGRPPANSLALQGH